MKTVAYINTHPGSPPLLRHGAHVVGFTFPDVDGVKLELETDDNGDWLVTLRLSDVDAPLVMARGDLAPEAQ